MKIKKINRKNFFTSFDGTKIFYYIGGVNKNGTLLFFHGLGGNLKSWDIQVSYFQKKGYQTIVFDLRGHGLSGHPKNVNDYSLDKFAEDIIMFLKIYSFKKVILIGHCLGGMIIPKLVERMKIKPKAIIFISVSIDPLRSNLFLYKNSKFLHLIARIPLKCPLPIGKMEQVPFEKFSGTGDFDSRRIVSDIFHTTLQSYLAISSYIIRSNNDSLLKKITCPTLIIHGAKDKIFPVSGAYILQQKIKRAKLVIFPTANHVIPINNPQELTYQIETYLNSL